MKSKKKLRRQESKSHRTSDWRHLLGWLALLFFLNLLAYSNSFHAGWHFDDNSNIVGNPTVHLTSFSWENVKNAMSSGVGGMRPVAYLSFALNYYFSGLNVFGYHVVNFGLHFLTACLVFAVFFSLARYWRPEYGTQPLCFFAFFTSVLWSVSPVQTQAVTYIVQRMALLSAFFVLLAFWLYVLGRNAIRRRWRWLLFAGTVVSALLAFGSKENSFIFPALLVAYEVIMRRRETILSRQRMTILVAAGILLTLVSGVIIHQAGLYERMLRDYSSRDFTLKQRLLTQPRVVVFYLSQLAFPLPSRLALEHQIEYSKSLFSPSTTLTSILLLGLLVAFAIRQRRSHPLITFSIAWFFLNHILESTAWPLEMIFEHRSYLPSMGVFAVATYPLLLLETGSSAWKKWIPPSIAVLCLLAGGSVYFSWERNKVWMDDLTLWRDNLEKNPGSFRVHDNLGTAYAERGYLEPAELSFREAIRLSPDRPGPRINMALLCVQDGRKQEALRWVEDLSIDKEWQPRTFFNLGVIYGATGQLQKAIESYSQAIALDPDSAETYYNLGLVYLKSGEIKKSRENFGKFLSKWQGDSNHPFVAEARRQVQEPTP